MVIVVAVVLARCESGWDDDDDSRVETKRRDDNDNDEDDEDRNTDNADTEEPNRERMVLWKTMTRKGTIRMLCFVTGIMTIW
jgi:uncharacterized membrane protein YcjF (UPF0283 family)